MLGPSLRCANTKCWPRRGAAWESADSGRGGAHREVFSKHPLIVAASATVAAVAPLFSFLGHSAPVRTLLALDSTWQGAGLLVWVVHDAGALHTAQTRRASYQQHAA